MVKKDRKGIAMQKQIWELRQRGVPIRKISESLRISRQTIRRYLAKWRAAGGMPQGVDEGPPPEEKDIAQWAIKQSPKWLQKLDYLKLLAEMRKGGTLTILWEESCALGCPVKYRGFVHALKKLQSKIQPDSDGKGCVRLNHKPAEKVFVDYCDGIEVIDSATGKKRKTHLFVGVFPFSGLTYAEFSFDQKQTSFIGSCERMWKAFGGVSEYLVCDNLRSAVNKADWYDPDVNGTFLEYANHAGFAPIPARPRKPRDKGSVENHVNLMQKDFFYRMRNTEFYSLIDLNRQLKSFLEGFNDKEMKDYGASRNERFSQESKYLKPLPANDYEQVQWKTAIVHCDCHVQVERHFYSVPHIHRGKEVMVKIMPKSILVIEQNTTHVLAAHARFLEGRGKRSTDESHWPDKVQEQLNFNLANAKTQAQKLGTNVYALVCHMAELPQPLQYLRRMQGLLRIYYSKKYPHESLEYSCLIALEKQVYRLAFIKDTAWKYSLVKKPLPEAHKAPSRPPQSVYQSSLYLSGKNICIN